MLDWTTCETCDETFKVLTDSDKLKIEFCPYCGSELELPLEEWDEDQDFEDDGDRTYFS